MTNENKKSIGFDSRVVAEKDLAQPREIFIFYLPSQPQLYGLKRTRGIWEITDKQKFNAIEEPKRSWIRSFLKQEYDAGRFKKGCVKNEKTVSKG